MVDLLDPTFPGRSIADGETFDFSIDDTTEFEISADAINAANASYQEGGTNISPIGTHDMFLDAGAFIPITASAKTEIIIGSLANRKGVLAIPFGSTLDPYATTKIIPPRNWNHGTITAVVHWTSQLAGVGMVQWDISAVAISDNNSLGDPATDFGAPQSVVDVQTEINQNQISPRTSAITVANNPADGDVIFIKVSRNSVDTFFNDAVLLGISLAFETDAATATAAE